VRITNIQAACHALNADSAVADTEILYPPHPHPTKQRKRTIHKNFVFLGPLKIARRTNGAPEIIIKIDEKVKKFILICRK